MQYFNNEAARTMTGICLKLTKRSLKKYEVVQGSSSGIHDVVFDHVLTTEYLLYLNEVLVVI